MPRFAWFVLLCLIAPSLLTVGCQNRTVEGTVNYKMVTAMNDRVYTIIADSGLSDEVPTIIVNVDEEEIKSCFPSEGNLAVDDSTEAVIEKFYTKLDYLVSIHLLSGEKYNYFLSYHVDQETFNRLEVGTRVKVETTATDTGPKISRIVTE